jgi:RND superfamily putative drug exporter
MFKKIGKLAYNRSKVILIIATVLVIVSASLGFRVFSVLKTGGFNDPKAGSTIAQQLINQNFKGQSNLVVLVQAKNGNVDSQSVRQIGLATAQKLAADTDIDNITSYWQTKSPELRSTNGSYALITAHLKGSDQVAATEAGQLNTELAKNTNSVSIKLGGIAAVNSATNTQVGKSLGIAESIAVPLTLLFLFLAFGTVVSALLPLAIALISIILTFAELFILGKFTNISLYSINLVTALGLGLSVDYALFIVSRYREELRNGASIDKAISTSISTAGRAIAFSAVAVTAALSVMAIFPLYFLQSFAYAGIGVVVTSALAAIFVLPAILKLLGKRIEKGRLPWANKVSRTESPFWRHIAQFVMRRPIMTALPVILFLIFLASPILHINFATPDERVLPTSNSARQVGDILRTKFSTNVDDQLQVVVTGSNFYNSSNTIAAKISNLPNVIDVSGAGRVYEHGQSVASQPTQSSQTASLVTVETNLDPQTAQAASLVSEIRAISIPVGSRVYTSGTSAQLVDTKHAISKRLPLAVAIIAITTFTVLFLFTGSVVQPIRALFTNALTLAATFGIIVWIFQEGHFSGFLNFTALPINITMPILLFCISFGLSMDYEIFLLSRIKEQHDKGASNDMAVSHGLARSGRIISTAACILAVSFFTFGTASISFLQLFGIGTGIAILLDATLVRGVLVPSFMHATQNFAWYAPKSLRKLHDSIGLSDE